MHLSKLILRRIRSNFWLCLSAAVLLAVHHLSVQFNWSLPRLLAGFLLTIYYPGFLLVRLLFPHRKLPRLFERTALSLGGSLLVLSAMFLLLNLTPAGLSPENVTAALYALIGVLTISNLIFARDENPSQISASAVPGFRCLFAALSAARRPALAAAGLAVIGVSMIFSTLALFIIAFQPAHMQINEPVTGFFVLDAQHMAAPENLVLSTSAPTQLTVGISNHSPEQQVYDVLGEFTPTQIFLARSVEVQAGQTVYLPVSLQAEADNPLEKYVLSLYEARSGGRLHSLYLQVADDQTGRLK
jgi:uncharacterized membrane protein